MTWPSHPDPGTLQSSVSATLLVKYAGSSMTEVLGKVSIGVGSASASAAQLRVKKRVWEMYMLKDGLNETLCDMQWRTPESGML